MRFLNVLDGALNGYLWGKLPQMQLNWGGV